MTETNRIEYKQELTDKLEKEVVAFLNYREGGVIYLGIDKNGKTIGINDSDADQLKIKDRLKHNIQPSCLGLFDVINQEQDGKNSIKITVARGSEKPYYLKKYGMTEKGCFIRIGSASEPMPIKMIEELFSTRTRDSIGNIKSRRQDLSFSQLKIYYEGAGFNLTDKFASNLDLLTESREYNYVAYLLADVNGASIKVAKYAGTDKCDLIENEEYGYCSLIKATNRVLDKLEIENKTFAKITGAAQRSERQMVDKQALREAFINAIVHNDYTREVTPVVEIYSDRLTVTSYGGLVEGLSQEDFFTGLSIPRNRELMRVFRDLDLVEQLGSGINRILKVYGQDNFRISDNFLIITFPFEEGYFSAITEQNSGSEKSSEKGSEKSSEKILRLISENNTITIAKLSEEIGISTRAIEKHLAKFKEDKLIERIGADRGGYWEVNK